MGGVGEEGKKWGRVACVNEQFPHWGITRKKKKTAERGEASVASLKVNQHRSLQTMLMNVTLVTFPKHQVKRASHNTGLKAICELFLLSNVTIALF